MYACLMQNHLTNPRVKNKDIAMLKRRPFLLSLTATTLAAAGSWRASAAETLPVPTGKTILRVSGAITATNQGNEAVFDRPMLEALGLTAFETKTPWYTDRVRFEGVSMNGLLSHLGATGTKLKVWALNDYTSEIPIADFAEFNVILALKRDGNYLEIRDKGPLFIVYPFDSDPALQSQKYYSRSPWQIARMQVA